MRDLIYLIFFDVITLTFWYWVCFKGGDKKWCKQIHNFWRGGAYKNLKPVHCKIFMWLFLIFLLIGNIGVTLNKLQ